MSCVVQESYDDYRKCYSCIKAYAYKYVCVYRYICTYIPIGTCIYTYIYIYIHMCVYLCLQYSNVYKRGICSVRYIKFFHVYICICHWILIFKRALTL